MNVLVSGCSFTHWPESPGSPNNICWPRYLCERHADWKVTNLAEPGAGNLYIANSLVRAIVEKPQHYDLVLVMWSGMTRLDFLTDIGDADWHRLFDDYGFYRRIESCPDRLGYIFSGGKMGPWFQNQASARVFREMYKVSDDLSLGHANLIEIIKAQDFLKTRGIKYRFMSYVNYWTTANNVSPNGDFGLLKYPQLACLIDAVDFDQWVFANDDKDGIYEMAKQAQDYHGDRFHPGPATHQRWADILIRSL